MIQSLVVVRILARRSLAVRLVLPLVVVGCWIYFYTPQPAWIGRWLETSLNLQSFEVIVAGPTIAAAGAWDLMHARSRGDVLLVSALRSYAEDASARLVSGLWWNVVVLIPVTLAATARNLLDGHRGFPALSVLALALGLSCLETAVALAIASVVPTVASVGVFLVACYAAVFVHTRQEMRVGLRRFFPLIEEHWDPGAVPLHGRLMLGAVWCAALSVAVLCAIGGLKRRPAGITWTGAVVTVAVVTGVGVLLLEPTQADSYFSARRSATESVCVDAERGRVCVWAPDAFQLPVLRSGYAAAERAAEGAVEVPDLLREQGLPPGASTSSIEFFFTSAPRTPAVVTGKVLEELVPLPVETCGQLLNVDSLGGYPLHFLVRDLLMRRAGLEVVEPDPTLAAALQRSVAAPRQQQDRWLTAAIGAIRTCGTAPVLPTVAS